MDQPDLQRRFSGLDRLWGTQPAQAVRRAHVVVVGVGGVGSWTVEALARSGVGYLTLIDLDQVAESNINRQIQALDNTVGMAKIDALKERIALINPECQVHGIEEWINPDNVEELLGGLPLGIDALVDACDQVKAKVALAQWTQAHRVRFIGIGAAGGKSQAHQVDVNDLARITHDPLLAQVRQRLRKAGAATAGKSMGWSYVYSTEPVQRPQAMDACDATLNCSGYGSLVTVTATFGLCAAGWVMKQIADAQLQKT
ncbi:MAG: tRNA threonylcarbamoyladenosine dehydratase [Alphaproteobacteria bacterium]|nr:tRNA threonylcarbamoyladenosine dehydratase [Alphaproteobacteria bacterium]